MTSRPRADLRPFFNPQTVALVGATEEMNRFGGRALARMMSFGFKGTIYPVNPRYKELQGLKCYGSVRDVPTAPDHVGIVVPAERVLGVLEDCASVGAKFATIFSGGFAESGSAEGKRLQGEVRAFAERTGIRIMGPNCNGLINFRDAFTMTSSSTIAGPRKPAGNVAVVAQSGGVGQANVMWRAQEAGVDISYEVSCGNSADLDLIDFIHFMVDDPGTDVILVVAEHIADGRRLFEAAERARAAQKPIVMLKLGRTEAGSKAAATHTGAMTGSDAVQDAAFRQCGIIRVEDCNELYEYAMLLRTKKWPRGNRAAATTISGGNGVLIVDLGASLGMSWPSYTETTQRELDALVPKQGSTGNPTDVTNAALGHPDMFSKAIGMIARDDNIDIVLPIFTLSPASDLQQAAAAAKAAEKPVAILWTGKCNDKPEFTPSVLAQQGVPVFRNTLSCLKAARAAVRYGEFVRKGSSDATRPAGIDETKARALLATSGTYTERQSKSVLAAYGFPVTQEDVARTADEAVTIAAKAGGPVALKIESADIPHKTEAGAIRLNVQGEAAVRKAFDEVMAAARAYKPDAKLAGVLVQEMAPQGLEVMLGLVQDPIYGPVVLAGLGGIHVEVLKDVAYRVAPVTHRDAAEMLQELRAYKLLTGVRGAPPRDIDALCDLIVRLSWLGRDCADRIAELDINPLILLEKDKGARVVDALVVTPGATLAAH